MADLQICKTCGVQHSSPSIEDLKNQCPICLDPRQYVPPTGQAWTTLQTLRDSKQYKNIFHPMDTDHTSTANLIAIHTEPQVAIGQTTYLVRTPEGNVLWDCITYLDDETVETIKGLGGVKAIAISHPHFFSTHVEWAKALNCPVFISAEDGEWLMRKDSAVQNSWTGKSHPLLPRITIHKIGGHFPGSAILRWDRSKENLPSVILTSDTIMSLIGGTVSVMWSYPNYIGLGPDEMFAVWRAVKDVDFEWLYGGWYTVPVIKDAKPIILKSLQRITKIMTDKREHPIFLETA